VNDASIVKEYIDNLVYGKAVKAQINYKEIPKEYLIILASYIASQSPTENLSKKVSYLKGALNNLRISINQGENKIERLTTYARIALDAGERTLAVNILHRLLDLYSKDINFEIREPFLPASKRYDNINPDNTLNEWLISSILETFIEKHAFSSYFTRRITLPYLEQLETLGFISDSMRRRLDLIKCCST
jgi:hypothetical protein